MNFKKKINTKDTDKKKENIIFLKRKEKEKENR